MEHVYTYLSKFSWRLSFQMVVMMHVLIVPHTKYYSKNTLSKLNLHFTKQINVISHPFHIEIHKKTLLTA